MKTSNMALVLAAFCALCVASAQAREPGGYFGVGLGQAKARDLPSSACSLLPTDYYACNVEDTKTAVKIFGGYQFSPYIAAEGTYIYFGDYEGTAISATPGNYPQIYSFEASGLSFDAVGTLPITEHFGLLGRVGATFWSVSHPADTYYYSYYSNYSDYDSGVSADYGVGFEIDFVRSFGLRAEYVEYNDIGKRDIGKSNIDVASLSAIFRF